MALIDSSSNPWLYGYVSVLGSLLFAAIGTWPVCLLVLALYRRAVARGMQRTSDPALPA